MPRPPCWPRRCVRRGVGLLALVSASVLLVARPLAAAPERVTIQLKWYPQFQSAGYYMAQQKGFFQDEDLDVTLKPGSAAIIPSDEVGEGRAQFGVSGVDLLVKRANGQPFVVVAAIFQHSPAMLMVLDASPVHSFADLAGRTIEAVPGTFDDVEFRTAMRAEGANPGSLRYARHTPDLTPFLTGRVDARSGYLTNEPDLMRSRGVRVRLLRASDYGVDFYSDCLFTTDAFASAHPDVVDRVRRACLQGWRYALDHPEEAITYLLTRKAENPSPLTRDHLRFEAKATAALIGAETVPIGHQSPDRWQHIADLLRGDGTLGHSVDVRRLIWETPEAAGNRQAESLLNIARTIAAVAIIVLLLVAGWTYQLRLAVRRKSVELEAAHRDIDLRGRALHSLLELSQELTHRGGAGNRLAQVIRQVRDGLGLASVRLFILDEASRELRGVAAIGRDGDPVDIGSERHALAESADPLVRVATGEGDGANATGAERMVPLRAGARTLGVLAIVGPPGSSSLDAESLRQLRGFADEIAIALLNAELLREAEDQQTRLARSNRELRALVAFSRSANAASPPETISAQIRRTLRDGFGFERASIYLLDGDVLRRHPGSDPLTLAGETEPGVVPLHAAAGRVGWDSLVDGRVDYLYAESGARDFGSTVDGQPVEHQALILLRAHERVLGLVAVDNFPHGKAFACAEVDRLVAFMQHAATVLDNVRLILALKESEERIWNVLSTISEATYAGKMEDGLLVPTFYSPQIERLTGYTRAEMEADPNLWIECIHPDDRNLVMEAVREGVHVEARPIEFRVLHKDGTVRWVLNNPVAIRDANGRIARLYGSILDVSERKQLEESLRQAQKMETVGTLAGGIAHEFNNLLAIIMGNIELAKMDAPEGSAAAHSLSQTERAVMRASDLTRQLLQFGRKGESERAEVSINDVVRATFELVNPTVGKTAAIELRLDEDVSHVYGDAGQLQQVLINLCVNARDAMPDGGAITIRTQNAHIVQPSVLRPGVGMAGDYVRLQVRDTGAGMDEATRQRVFEPFYTTKPVGRGTGLGLAVAYAIVADHHGWIEVESHPGKGTVFSVYIPAVTDGIASREPVAVLPGRSTVLVVDQDATDREALAGILESHGYFVLTAADGSEALALYWTESERMAVVVCDTADPEREAAAFVRNVRLHDPDAEILLTGSLEHLADARRIKDLRGLRTLPKPYREDEVVRALNASAG